MRSAQTTLARVAGAIAPSRTAFVDALVAIIEREIAELNHDEAMRRLLRASVSENVDRLVDLMATGRDPRHGDPPHGAMDYASRLAHGQASLASLLRAYRFGQGEFTAHCLRIANEEADSTAESQIHMVDTIAAYLDHVCEKVTEAYLAEHSRWVSGQQGLRQSWVSRVLAGGEFDAEAATQALGYDLAATHVAVCVWVDDDVADAAVQPALNRAVAALQTAAGPVPGLVVAHTDRLLRAWFAVSTAHTRLHLDAPVARGTRMAIGTVEGGVSGFRTSHARAERVREVVRAGGPDVASVVHWPEVAAVAMVTRHDADVAAMVAHTLGALGAPGARNAELRETLRVFLELDRSFAATAGALHVHRNTVRYRVQQALELSAKPLDGNVFALLAALTACRWAPELAKT